MEEPPCLRLGLHPSIIRILETMIHCLHGAVGSYRDWDQLTDSMPGQIRPLDLWRLLDGPSPSLSEAGTIIAQEANQDDILIGYSMGGRLALHALLADPDKWRGAIIVSAHPGLRIGHLERQASDRRWANLAQRDWEAFLRSWNDQGVLSGVPAGLHQAGFGDREAVSKSFHFWSLGCQEDLRSSLARIKCPVLWLTGEKDLKFTELAEEVCPLLPQGRHLVIPHCGHRLPWESPASFHEAVEKFLDSLRKDPSLNS